ncbi:hypothetical protein M2347_001870 [Chryseobacterium sp. H1D6B]|nr:hypothetical protein [Chryseobacterium sp. H1D6B]
MDNNITSNMENTDPGTPNTMPTSFVQNLVDNYRNR